MECQGEYSTYDIAESAKTIGTVSDKYRAVFICTIVLYILAFFFTFMMCFLNVWIVLIATILELGGYAALIILYSQLQNAVNKVDIYMMEYLRDNECTDGALARAITKYAETYVHDMKVTSVGLAFVLFSAASLVLMVVCLSKPCRKMMQSCCCCKKIKESPSYEQRAFSMHNSIRGGI